MKPFWKHVHDEMERHILAKAQRSAYLFLIASLFLWTMYESIQVYLRHTRPNLLSCLLLTGAALVQSFSQLILTRGAVKDDSDSCETAPLARLIVLSCAAAGVLAAAVAAVVLLAVHP